MTAHERAVLAAEKAYREHIDGRPMKHACDAYLADPILNMAGNLANINHGSRA